MPRSDLPASIGLILFGAFVLYESLRMPRFERIGGTIHSSPGLVPGALGAIIGLLGVVMLLRYLAAGSAARSAAVLVPPPGAAAGSVGVPPGAADAAAAAEEAKASEAVERPGPARLLWTLGLSVLFAAGMVGRMPFWLATFLFVLAFIVVFEWRTYTDTLRAVKGLGFAVGIAAATAFAVPFVFERVFLVRLP